VEPEQVDVVGAKPAQALLERLDEVLTAVAARVGIVATRGQRVLRREHQPLAPALRELAEQRLALAVGVVAGGVDEVAARVDERVEHTATLLA
jgi:hypothetical protein